MKKVGLIIVALFSVFLVAGCSGGDDSPADAVIDGASRSECAELNQDYNESLLQFSDVVDSVDYTNDAEIRDIIRVGRLAVEAGESINDACPHLDLDVNQLEDALDELASLV